MLKLFRVKLYETKDETAQYACLSHIWASHAEVITTKSNLANRLSGISIDELPKTYQDAIDVIRKLNIRYIWIDSLCIVQDDAEDWHCQAAMMGPVYENAYVTIAADLFQENDALEVDKAVDGLFTDIPAHYLPQVAEFAHPFKAGETSRIGLRLVRAHYHSHLYNRGWIFQEEFLSPRFMRFRTGEIILQCAQTKCSGCATSHNNLAPRNSVSIPETFAVLRPNFDGPAAEPFQWTDHIATWHKLVEKYMRRRLTYGKDIFPALSSIVKRYMSTAVLGGDATSYAAGLWIPFFEHDLLWAPNRLLGSHQKRPTPWRAPSWSWASQKDFVWFCQFSISHCPETLVVQQFHLRDIVIMPVGMDPMGELASAHALLDVRIVPVVLEYDVPFLQIDGRFEDGYRPDKNRIWLRMGNDQKDAASGFKDMDVDVDYALYTPGPHHIPSGSPDIWLMSVAAKGPMRRESSPNELFVLRIWLLLRRRKSRTDMREEAFERIGRVEAWSNHRSSADLHVDCLCGDVPIRTIRLE
jgi:hypothetical protein